MSFNPLSTATSIGGEQVHWRVWKSWSEQWTALPSFLLIEYTFYLLVLSTLAHALRHSRAHIYVWLLAFVAGAANDIFFMALPVVDNFWQAQATLMLTPRLPLYIPCVYNVFMYCATVLAWRLRLPYWAECVAAGLFGELIYAPYDICGAKFLWWTWHDSDAAIGVRLLGAPIGSTMWVVLFTASFAFIVRLVVGRRQEVATGGAGGGGDDDDDDGAPKSLSIGRFLAGLVVGAALSTPTMLVGISAFNALNAGAPGYLPLAALLVCFGAALVAGLRARSWRPPQPSRGDFALNLALVFYFVLLALTIVAAKPERHISAGLHQPTGPCDRVALDILGNERAEYLCPANFDEPFTFECATSPPAPNEVRHWYTVCGVAHGDAKGTWMAAVGALAMCGVYSISYVLGFYSDNSYYDPRRHRALAKKLD
jgi:hypothetical protein